MPARQRWVLKHTHTHTHSLPFGRRNDARNKSIINMNSIQLIQFKVFQGNIRPQMSFVWCAKHWLSPKHIKVHTKYDFIKQVYFRFICARAHSPELKDPSLVRCRHIGHTLYGARCCAVMCVRVGLRLKSNIYVCCYNMETCTLYIYICILHIIIRNWLWVVHTWTYSCWTNRQQEANLLWTGHPSTAPRQDLVR